MMVRKLETGEYLLDRDPKVIPPNRLRPVDATAEQRHDDNKKALFKKL
jgi:hypothetical protein